MGFDPLSSILDVAGKVIDKVFPDPEKKAAAQLALLELAQKGELASMIAQTDINKIEAANPRLLVSGWRPGAGWVCVASLALQFIVNPLATWIAALCGHPIVFPNLDMGSLLVILGGMLGLSTNRMVEKVNGVASK